MDRITHYGCLWLFIQLWEYSHLPSCSNPWTNQNIFAAVLMEWPWSCRLTSSSSVGGVLTACVVWTAFNTGLESYECLKSAVWDAQDVPQEKVIGGDKDKPFGAINRPCMFTVSTQESGHVISQYYEFDFWDICWLVYSCFFHSLPLQWWVISENLVLSEVRSGGRGKYVNTTFDSPLHFIPW